MVNENQNLQNKINNNNIDYSPILFSDNRINNFQTIEKPEKIMILEKNNNNLNKMNNIKIMNNNKQKKVLLLHDLLIYHLPLHLH